MLSGKSGPQNKEKPIIEKDIYDTYVEDIFIKKETYKIIVFKKRPADSQLLEEAAKMV